MNTLETQLVNVGGDTLYFNSLRAIAYNDKQILKQLQSECLRDGKWWRSVKHYIEGKDNLSRDQIGMFIIACKLLGYPFDHANISDKRLSKEYKKTIDFRLWEKAVKTGRKWHIIKWRAVQSFLLLFSLVWNKILYFLAGFKLQTWETWQYTPRERLNKFQRWACRNRYPDYALIICAWQNYIFKNTWLNYTLTRLIRKLSYPGNGLINILTGSYLVSIKIPLINSFIWSRRPDETNNWNPKSQPARQWLIDLNRDILCF